MKKLQSYGHNQPEPRVIARGGVECGALSQRDVHLLPQKHEFYMAAGVFTNVRSEVLPVHKDCQARRFELRKSVRKSARVHIVEEETGKTLALVPVIRAWEPRPQATHVTDAVF